MSASVQNISSVENSYNDSQTVTLNLSLMYPDWMWVFSPNGPDYIGTNEGKESFIQFLDNIESAASFCQKNSAFAQHVQSLNLAFQHFLADPSQISNLQNEASFFGVANPQSNPQVPADKVKAVLTDIVTRYQFDLTRPFNAEYFQNGLRMIQGIALGNESLLDYEGGDCYAFAQDLEPSSDIGGLVMNYVCTQPPEMPGDDLRAAIDTLVQDLS